MDTAISLESLMAGLVFYRFCIGQFLLLAVEGLCAILIILALPNRVPDVELVIKAVWLSAGDQCPQHPWPAHLPSCTAASNKFPKHL